VFDEFAGLTANYAGLSHSVLGTTGKLWPCKHPETDDGERILFSEDFPTASGRARFVPCPWKPARELPDDEFPFILNTGRVLEHWHTGTMTRRSHALNEIEPAPFVAVHPDDLRRLAIQSGELIQVSSRRGRITLRARADNSVEPGCVFIPFHFREAGANLLTIDALDPFGKIPEFKFCAVRIDRPAGRDQFDNALATNRDE